MARVRSGSVHAGPVRFRHAVDQRVAPHALGLAVVAQGRLILEADLLHESNRAGAFRPAAAPYAAQSEVTEAERHQCVRALGGVALAPKIGPQSTAEHSAIFR